MTMLDANDKRTHVHAMWTAVAPGWADYADEVDRRGALMTERLLAGARLTGGERVLELASGPGGAGLAAADAVGRQGHVVISDVVPEMVAVAASRATARGLGNVTVAVLDLEAIAQPDDAFDVVVCREGLMFAVEPARALSEIRRVLRPGGRVALSVWGPRAANPWLGLLADGVTEVIGTEIPPPGMPGPFALADQGELAGLVERAGFDSVSAEALDVPLRAPSFDAWWARTRAVAGPVAAIIAGLDEARSADLVDRLRAATAPYTTHAGLEFPGLAVLVWGQAAAQPATSARGRGSARPRH